MTTETTPLGDLLRQVLERRCEIAESRLEELASLLASMRELVAEKPHHMDAGEPGLVYNVQDVAETLKVSRSSVYGWLRSGELRPVACNSSKLVTAMALQAFISVQPEQPIMISNDGAPVSQWLRSPGYCGFPVRRCTSSFTMGSCAAWRASAGSLCPWPPLRNS